MNEKLKKIFGSGAGKILYNFLSAKQNLGSLPEAWDHSPTSSLGTVNWLLDNNVNDTIFHELKWK